MLLFMSHLNGGKPVHGILDTVMWCLLIFMPIPPWIATFRASEKSLDRRNRKRTGPSDSVLVLREIEREEFKSLQKAYARRREELSAKCDKCGEAAVEAKRYKWYACGHEIVLFACEKCGLQYQMPCPNCAEQKKRVLEERWRWLLKAAAYLHIRDRFVL